MKIASCGHEIPPNKTENFINIKGVDFDGLNCVKYYTTCDECLNQYVFNEIVLFTEDEIQEWLDQ